MLLWMRASQSVFNKYPVSVLGDATTETRCCGGKRKRGRKRRRRAFNSTDTPFIDFSSAHVMGWKT